MNSRPQNKYCFVPGCKSTSKSTPQKLFFNVPQGKDRNKWCKIVRREKTSPKSVHHCCEDHFEPEKDVEDWLRYKLMLDASIGTFKLRLKTGVAPHIFDCQPDRKLSHSKAERSAVAKRTSLGILQDALTNTLGGAVTDQNSSVAGETVGNDSQGIPNFDVTILNTSVDKENQDPQEREINGETTVLSTSVDAENQEPHGREIIEETRSTADFSCQARLRKPYRSRGTQAEVAHMVSVATSPIKVDPRKRRYEESDDTVSITSYSSIATIVSLDPSYNPDDDFSAASGDELSDEMIASQQLSITLRRIEKNPKRYLGLDPESMRILDVLEVFSRVDRLTIFIVLRKVRTNESYDLLADAFGCHKSKVSRALTDGAPKIAKYLKKLIFWPEKKITQRNLPVAFRANYAHVESIIDCFETRIEQPSNPVHQALTWSDYKKCNTVKYLLSITPSGLINFVSKGFGGRSSDQVIVETSSFLDILKPHTYVMADRGFKQIESVLAQKQCYLIRPPSVSADVKMTEGEVRQTKVIASLRIHVERVIRRIREYAILDPNSHIRYNSLHLVDAFVTIACALSNMQGTIVE